MKGVLPSWGSHIGEGPKDFVLGDTKGGPSGELTSTLMVEKTRGQKVKGGEKKGAVGQRKENVIY